jgi:hypothetical protein
LKKIIKGVFFNNIGLTCNFAELIASIRFTPQVLTREIVILNGSAFYQNPPRPQTKISAICGTAIPARGPGGLAVVSRASSPCILIHPASHR